MLYGEEYETALTGSDNEYVMKHHHKEAKEHQCTSNVLKRIKAPMDIVWSVVRRFDQPQRYKPFVKRCVVLGNVEVGCIREINVKTGLPATTSTERLDRLDDDEHIISVSFVGGDHRLQNYNSIMSVHPETIEGEPGAVVIESFVVDIPEGNDRDDTRYFVESLIKLNLKALKHVSLKIAKEEEARKKSAADISAGG